MSSAPPRRKMIARALPVSLAILLGGCVSASPKSPLPAAALQAPLGRVAVVTFANTRGIQLQVPDSKTDIARETAAFVAVSPTGLREVAPLCLLRAPEVAAGFAMLALGAPVVLMVGQPIAQEVRRGYGLLKADTAAEVAIARNSLEQAVAGIRFEEILRGKVVAELPQNAPHFALASTDAFAPGCTNGELNYAALRSRADTILEIKVLEPNLGGADGINPPLALRVHVRVRLLDAQDGSELYYDYLEYRGAHHQFVQWGASDAALIRAELRACTDRLAAEIVAQLFTRRRGERADAAALAALGIRHRPSSG